MSDSKSCVSEYFINEPAPSHNGGSASDHAEESVASVDRLGVKMWVDKNGELHRVGGPAFEDPTGCKAWYRHGKRHNDDGPAMVWECSPTGDEYWLNGTQCRKEEWEMKRGVWP